MTDGLTIRVTIVRDNGEKVMEAQLDARANWSTSPYMKPIVFEGGAYVLVGLRIVPEVETAP